MPGKTRIGGTAYTIKGGKTKINGTNYSIKQGKTRIDGTAYTISFGKTLTVSGTDTTSGDDLGCALLNGSRIVDGTRGITDSDTLKVYVGSNSTSYTASCKVYLNGSVVKSGMGAYTISNISSYNTITIKFTKYTSGSYLYYHCNITTT